MCGDCGSGFNWSCVTSCQFGSKFSVNNLTVSKITPRFCGVGLEIVNAQVGLKNVAVLPASANIGTLLYNSTDKKVYVYTGTGWDPLN